MIDRTRPVLVLRAKTLLVAAGISCALFAALLAAWLLCWLGGVLWFLGCWLVLLVLVVLGYGLVILAAVVVGGGLIAAAAGAGNSSSGSKDSGCGAGCLGLVGLILGLAILGNGWPWMT